MTDIIIQGIGGRMGHALCEMIAKREDCRVVAGIDVKDGEQNGIPVYDSLEKLEGKGDVIIDFSSPAAVEKALPYCEAHKLPIVVCTTGLSEELQLKVVQLSRTVAVFKSANMSMGINVLSELCKRASAILGVDYDVEIVEQHHHNKLDAPSGTALMLADAINEENNGEDDPGETGHRQRLAAIEASGLDAQKAQTAARDHGDADCREVARRRLPFLKDQRRRQGKGHERGEEQQERSQVVPDNAQVVEGESLPHSPCP